MLMGVSVRLRLDRAFDRIGLSSLLTGAWRSAAYFARGDSSGTKYLGSRKDAEGGRENIIQKILKILCESITSSSSLPRWLSGLRHSAHRPERSAGGAGFNPRVGR